MMNKLCFPYISKTIAISFILVFSFDIVFPTVSFALSGGASQPEVESFMPVATSDMVNPSTGDFNYNIPLMDVGGYPINLFYNSGVSMEDEASWVGLGWNINAGVINRSMRGLPDDFNGMGEDGDRIKQTTKMRDYINASLSTSIGSTELFGFEFDLTNAVGTESGGSNGINYTFGINYNNRSGFGFHQSLGLSMDLVNTGGKNGGVLGMNMNLGSNGQVNASPKFRPAGDGPLKKDKDESEPKKPKSKNTEQKSTYKERLGMKWKDMNNNANYKVANRVSGSMLSGVSRAISYNKKAYIPSYNFDHSNFAMSLGFSLGGDIFGGDISLAATLGLSLSTLDASQSIPAYGYLNTQYDDGRGLLDFDREFSSVMHKRTNFLPLTNMTYDYYSALGHGVSGSFRPYRTELGHVHDPYKLTSENDNVVETIADDFSLQLEINPGTGVDWGAEFVSNNLIVEQGVWSDGNPMLAFTKNKSSSSNGKDPYYFKQVGELSVDDDMEDGTDELSVSLYEKVLKNEPVNVKINNNNSTLSELEGYVLDDQELIHIESNIDQSLEKENEAKRNQLFSYLTKKEAQILGKYDYSSSVAKDHHLQELTVTRDDGARYVYGLPAYITKHEEYNFSVSGSSLGSTVKTNQTEMSSLNESGIDKYYSKKEIDPYAHAYMLTEILSADYQDISGNGPTNDDVGTWVKFNYETVENYKWRSPMQGANLQNESGQYYTYANFNEGIEGNPNDNMGSVTYGTKNLHYLTKITTPSHIAIFNTSTRSDAKESVNQYGGVEAEGKMKRLNSIALYNKHDYQLHGTNATPIKIVHLSYDHSLCSNTPNSSLDGKLTLKKVHFTYGNSQRGLLSPYAFEYSDVRNNYAPDKMDIWGYSKAAVAYDNPYVDQNDDSRGKEFNLTKIQLPSGAEINIEFESDDYAYVQNKEALMLYNIAGFGKDNQGSYSPTIYDGQARKYLYVDLPSGVTTTDGMDYVNGFGEKWVYFNVHTNLYGTGTRNAVGGYFKIDFNEPPFIHQNGKLVIKIQLMKLGNNISDGVYSGLWVSPFAKAAWQFNTVNCPEWANGEPTAGGTQTMQDILQNLANSDILVGLIKKAQGPNGVQKTLGYGKYITPSKSWVRLGIPKGIKKGGDTRVASILFKDNWNLVDESKSGTAYGQVFEYKLNDGRSSGVADFEPYRSLENPFKYPLVNKYDDLVGMKYYYEEGPIGKSLYPLSKIYYSRVMMHNVAYKLEGNSVMTEVNSDQRLSALGSTEFTYYTSKDYPTISKSTGIDKRGNYSPKGFSVGELFNLGSHITDKMTASQGYVVELNDMAGKPKSISVYPALKTGSAFIDNITADPISRTEYNYDPEMTGELVIPENLTSISNTVPVINTDGSISQKTLGVEMDMLFDFREMKSNATSVAISANVGINVYGVWPIPHFSLWTTLSTTNSTFRSASTSKVIFRRGILREVIKEVRGNRVSTKNLAWDAETGNVLVTGTTNEYGEDLYSFHYPAHWAYKGMAQAYKEWNKIGSISTDNSGKVLSGASSLTPGDEIIYPYEHISARHLWVANDNGEKYLINRDGSPSTYAGNRKYKIVRPYEKNMQSLPIGSVICKENPVYDGLGGLLPELSLKATSAGDDFSSKEVLFADASTFKNTHRIPSYSDEAFDYLAGNNDPDSMALAFAHYMANLGTGTFDLSSELSCYKCVDGESIQSCPDLTGVVTSIGSAVEHYTLTLSCSEDKHPSACFELVYDDAAAPIKGPWITDFANGNVNDFYVAPSNFFSGSTIPFCESECDGIENLVVFRASDDIPILNFAYTAEILPNCEPNCIDDVSSNPYVIGIAEAYRAEKAWYWLTERTYNGGANEIDINGAQSNEDVFEPKLNKAGYYSDFSPFWYYDNGVWLQAESEENWKYTSNVEEYFINGLVVENKNVLDIYSATQLGYDFSLSVAQGSNMKHNEMAFDGFEDYEYQNCLYKKHIEFKDYNGDSPVDSNEAHTGYFSARIPKDNYIIAEELYVDGLSAQSIINTANFTIDNSWQLGVFSPGDLVNAKTYLLGFWVKEESEGYLQPELYTVVDGESPSLISNIDLTYQGQAIEGWVRKEYKITLPSGVANQKLQIRFMNGNEFAFAYVDDVRLHPYDGQMSSIVYHHITQKPIAELDANNYATFYEYDAYGKVIRVKKETSRGVKTLQENYINTASSIQ